MLDLAVETVLGREERVYPAPTFGTRKGMQPHAIVTGGEGSLGRPLRAYLTGLGIKVISLDILTGFDLLASVTLRDVVWTYSDNLVGVWHCAAFKDAPGSALLPYECASLNIETTRNVIAAANDVNAKVILASTGKVGDACTPYSASKVVCEAMTMNYQHGRIGRLYNCYESADNVWRYLPEQMKEHGRIFVTDTYRYWLTINEAVTFMAGLADAPRGRYAAYTGESRSMMYLGSLWSELNGVPMVEIPPRRGDRTREPLHGLEETLTDAAPFGNRITSINDPDGLPPLKGEEHVSGDLHLPEKFRNMHEGDLVRAHHYARGLSPANEVFLKVRNGE